MLLTLGATGATLLVAAILLGGPVLSACTGDSRGAVACLRGMVDDRFDGAKRQPAAPEPVPAKPVVAELPVAEPATPAVPAVKAPPAGPSMEPAASPPEQPVAEQPAAPKPEVAEPLVVIAPAVPPPLPKPVADPEPQLAEVPDEGAVPPDTIALATVIPAAPDATVATRGSPSFVPPPPPIQVDGVPPDLQVALAAPVAAPPVAPATPAFTPSITPEVPAAPPTARPPAAPAPEAESEPAAAFVLQATPALPASPPPDLVVAAAPAPPAPGPTPAPAFVLPAPPALPAAPPPDLAVAAIDPAVPPVEPATVPPVLTPSIDAVEIDGGGNFFAGNGPPGATMRLYVDGIPAGVSPVAGGRWLVEGSGLLTGSHQTLRVEALDPVTGKVLGEATVAFEGPRQTGAVQDEAPPVLPTRPPGAVPKGDPPRTYPVEPPIIETPELVLPPVTPTVPSRASPSVTILKPAGGGAIATLPTGKPSDDAVVNLSTRPDAPALTSDFTLPTWKTPDIAVLRAVPIGDPDAGRFVSGKAIIRRGDTLWDIAHRYYGHGVHYRTIFRANRELIARPGRIYPGQVFELPLVYDD